MTTLQSIELTDDIRGGADAPVPLRDTSWGEWYRRMHAYGTCANERYANSRTGHRDQNPSWPCAEYLNGSRPTPPLPWERKR